MEGGGNPLLHGESAGEKGAIDSRIERIGAGGESGGRDKRAGRAFPFKILQWAMGENTSERQESPKRSGGSRMGKKFSETRNL